MMDIKNLIVFDTEFINSKDLKQPVQVSFIGYEINEGTLVKKDDFNVYIQTKDDYKVSKYLTKYTGIDSKLLKESGEKILKARKHVLNYLNSYNLKTTLILGWDIQNDIIMFRKLFKYLHPLFNMSKLQFLDISKLYSKLNKYDHLIALKKVAESYDFSVEGIHNSYVDTKIISKILLKMIKQYKLEKIIDKDNIIRPKNKG